MEPTIDSTLKQGRAAFDKAMDHLKGELQKIRAGKASPSMLNGIMVDYYGCLLYTSPSPRDRTRSRMPSSA